MAYPSELLAGARLAFDAPQLAGYAARYGRRATAPAPQGKHRPALDVLEQNIASAA